MITTKVLVDTNSPPVGPPPHTTKLNSLFLSASSVPGKQAFSRLSITLRLIP